jgi:hypothetical protein
MPVNKRAHTAIWFAVLYFVLLASSIANFLICKVAFLVRQSTFYDRYAPGLLDLAFKKEIKLIAVADGSNPWT